MKQLKKAGRFLCSMKFAIILLVVIVLVCTVGSVVPQGKDASWYTANYSRQAAGAVMLFGLDDVFHSWWFIVLTLFLCMNLLLCS
ncbi:MAG: cytochrome c biogenesis protein ResB, partial [Lachnospiraceae bacterium]|nr:cytochrome c biogenesis protein ResB [Lachnospiraceae bacterium]